MGTRIEGALRGIAHFTAANVTHGREMIGVLMTDGDPNGCENDVATLRDDHRRPPRSHRHPHLHHRHGGRHERQPRKLAVAGGAEPHDDCCGDGPTPCHYWNVGDGSGDAIASALQAIVATGGAAALRVSTSRASMPPAGETHRLRQGQRHPDRRNGVDYDHRPCRTPPRAPPTSPPGTTTTRARRRRSTCARTRAAWSGAGDGSRSRSWSAAKRRSLYRRRSSARSEPRNRIEGSPRPLRPSASFLFLAEEEGFEPTAPLRVRRFSRSARRWTKPWASSPSVHAVGWARICDPSASRLTLEGMMALRAFGVWMVVFGMAACGGDDGSDSSGGSPTAGSSSGGKANGAGGTNGGGTSAGGASPGGTSSGGVAQAGRLRWQ